MNTVRVGLVLTRNDNGTNAVTADFDHVETTGMAPAWAGVNIGGATPAGFFAEPAANALTLTGGGLGMWAADDNAYYVNRASNGNCVIQARITGVTSSNWGSSRGGIMIRENMTSGGKYVYLGKTAGGEIDLYSQDAGQGATPLYGVPATYWLRLERDATTHVFTAKTAPDVSGQPGTWTQLGTRTVTMSAVSVGFVVCRSDNGTNAVTATFDNVMINP
jgi:hypothetical protein